MGVDGTPLKALVLLKNPRLVLTSAASEVAPPRPRWRHRGRLPPAQPRLTRRRRLKVVEKMPAPKWATWNTRASPVTPQTAASSASKTLKSGAVPRASVQLDGSRANQRDPLKWETEEGLVPRIFLGEKQVSGENEFPPGKAWLFEVGQKHNREGFFLTGKSLTARFFTGKVGKKLNRSLFMGKA